MQMLNTSRRNGESGLRIYLEISKLSDHAYEKFSAFFMLRVGVSFC